METDMQESNILSNLMDDFPPISKQDPIDVQAAYVYDHWKTTGEIFKYNDFLDTMYGASLPIVSKKRKSKKKADVEEASEPKPKRLRRK